MVNSLNLLLVMSLAPACKMAAASRSSRSLFGRFKQGWNEIPEVIGSSFMAIIGIGLASVGLANYYKKGGDNRKYKQEYVVYRSDDPRAEKVRGE